MPNSKSAANEQTRTVVVWRSTWLQNSETFIRSQVDHLESFDAICVGLGRVDSPLSRETDVALYGSDRRLDRFSRSVAEVLGFSPRLTRYLRQTRPDVVHAHFAFDGMLAARSAHKAGIPVVVTVHGVDVTMLPSRPGPRGALYRRRLRRMFSRSSAIVAVSEHIREVALQRGAAAARVHVLTTGVRTRDISATGLAHVADDPPDVLFVGRLVEKKGVDDLLDAVRRLSERGVRPRVVLIGDGPERLKVTESIADLDGDVTWIGSRPADETQAYVQASRVVAVPSRTASNGDSEGLPTIVLEAAAAGVPVVSTYHSGIPEAVIDGETGLLVREGDAEALADAIERLLQDPVMCARLGAAAAERVRDRYDVRKQTRLLESIYESVLSTRDEQSGALTVRHVLSAPKQG